MKLSWSIRTLCPEGKYYCPCRKCKDFSLSLYIYWRIDLCSKMVLAFLVFNTFRWSLQRIPWIHRILRLLWFLHDRIVSKSRNWFIFKVYSKDQKEVLSKDWLISRVEKENFGYQRESDILDTEIVFLGFSGYFEKKKGFWSFPRFYIFSTISIHDSFRFLIISVGKPFIDGFRYIICRFRNQESTIGHVSLYVLSDFCEGFIKKY